MRLSLISASVSFAAVLTSAAWADGLGRVEMGVPLANSKGGSTSSTLIDPGFQTRLLATRTDVLENPSGCITNYGMLNNAGNCSNGTPLPTLTEPDENTYVIFSKNPGGPDPRFDYGRNFLYQGHENGSPIAYITRINLDVPRGDAHRITLLTPVNQTTGKTGFGSIDGSTYDPFTDTLLFTQEAGSSGGVIQITTSWPPAVNTLDAFLGKGGYEGIHSDDEGNIYLIEDAGGATTHTSTPIDLRQGRQPNSFVHRFIPNNPNRIEDGGKLQALQVIVDGTPIVFHAADPDGDISSDAQAKLHTPGTSYPIAWVTVHTSNAGDTVGFDANAAAKAAGATPFKRPENMAWLPGSNFGTFFFDPTGDTDAIAGENPFLQKRGSYGAIFRVDLGRKPSDGDGQISLFVLGDHDHNSFDNLSFVNQRQLLAAEDRGDTLHTQLNTLDSVWAFDVEEPLAIRFIALGRDATSVAHGEDNEPTGVYVSNGRTQESGLLGTKNSIANPRGFFTQQHGDNNTYEIFSVPASQVGSSPVSVP
jgi:Alkaline phosphatase PhoX